MSATTGVTKTKPFIGAIADFHPRFSAYASAASIFHPQYRLDENNAVLGPIEGRNAGLRIKGESADQRSFCCGIDATSTGFELDVAGKLAPGWEVRAGDTHMRIKGADGQDARTYVPRQTLRLSSTVDVAVVPGLQLGASLRWQSAFSRDEGASGVTRQDAYALVDLMARYALNKQCSLSAYVNNLTDEKTIASLMWSQGYHAAPRGVSVSLNWKH